MDFAKLLSCCLRGDSEGIQSEKQPLLSIIDEKPTRQSMHQSPIGRNIDTTARDIIRILVGAKKNDETLARDVDEAVGIAGWSEWLAQKVLDKLKQTIADGSDKMGDVLTDALDKAYAVADKEFSALVKTAKEHPLELAATILLTLVAIGVLAELTPLVVELLGFGELGPIEGSFAAWWESNYGGYIPAGSLFSYLQRLGMTWRK
ncbi:hypothetical protein B0T11DRAFT_269885 [Plectosphaerella cucumerina]|uniref:Uncharacterized protein n=1 Tax=Plectosphaerella cucumerina TaxID=40658 RepID=A0A8K0TRB2_9PEZI|nr:hypothetical protein B0T11DRAFT_269885 [Plectosphaerella cucumerina]